MHEELERAFQEAQDEVRRMRAAAEERRAEEQRHSERVRSIVEPYFDTLAPAVLEKLAYLAVPPNGRKGMRYWDLGNSLWDSNGWNGFTSHSLAITKRGRFISTSTGKEELTEESGQRALLSSAFFFGPPNWFWLRKGSDGPLCIEEGTNRVCILVEEVGGSSEGLRAWDFAEHVGKQLHYLHTHRR